MSIWVCSECKSEIASETDAEGVTRWSCECGQCWGIQLPRGELDLGLIPEPTGLRIFVEEFTTEEYYSPGSISVPEAP